MNKLMKKIVTVVLAFTMVMGMVLPVAASNPGHQTGTPSGAEITKVLKVPVGAVKPTENFEFRFTALGITSDANGALIANTTGMPTIGTAGVVTVPSPGIDPSSPLGGYQIFKGTVDAFAAPAITGNSFPHAGVYVYEIEELEPGTPTGGIIYSKAKYEMYVYVTNDVIGTSLKINDVGFRMTALDGVGIDPVGTTLPTQAVDPDSGTNSSAGKADPIFTNRYTPPADLEITKTVAGGFADTKKLFTYTLTVTRPQEAADADGAQTYIGTIYNGTTASSDTVTVTFGAKGTANELVGTVTSTTVSPNDGTFKLSHGQKLDFLDASGAPEVGIRTGLPMGSTWTLTETGEARYTPSVAIVNNGASVTGPTGGENTTMTIPASGSLTLGDNENSAAWTNTYRDVTPTGILLNNLPFILLILVAVGGFTGYIVSKRRKAMK